MKRFGFPRLLAFAVCCLLGGVPFAGRSFLRPDGPAAPWDLTDCRQELEEAQARGEQLAEEDGRLYARILARAAVTDDLIAGRLTLAEGIARFRAAGPARRPLPPRPFDRLPGLLDEEREGRRLLKHVAAELEARNADRTVLVRLERDLEEHLARGRVGGPDGPRP